MRIIAFFLSIFLGVDLLAQPVTEPAGPSSRRTPLAITEIMYMPADRADALNTEFIELYNSNPWAEDISGYRIDGQVRFVFPASTAIPGFGFIVLAAVPADLRAAYGLTNVFGPFTNSLKTAAEVKLYDEQGSLLLDIHYDGIAPWPMGASGTGHSIVLARPSYGEGDARAWERSELAGGSPGAAEAWQTNALRHVVINEILAHPNPQQADYLELYNHGNEPVDVSGCTLSDDPATNQFTIPAGTIIPARGFACFTETQLGFGLNAAGETVYFKNTNATQVLDALKFEAQESGVSFGRYPDGADEWSRLSAPTFGAGNAVPLASPVGFNEIMYHPLVGGGDAQYVELFNHGTNAVSLDGWKLGGGIRWTFASNQVLAAGGYLVVGRNTSYLLTNYAQLNAANTVGNSSGKLSGAGERLTLTMPATTWSTNTAGNVTAHRLDITVDEVTYGTGGRWGRWSDGGGSNLELIDARADKRRAANWADSDETAKAPWATLETTGVLDNGSGAMSLGQLGLLAAGECLIDDVEVRSGTNGPNCAGNPGFENGMNNLAFVGDHCRSCLETNSGYPAGGVALHLRTADSILTGPNGVQITLPNTSGLASGKTATLRFKARWLRGCPEPLLRFWGCHLEATGRLPVPSNLGTPGLPNSQASMNAGPAIYQVSHAPAVPAPNQPIVVTARVSDPDGLASLVLQYRFDPATATTNLVMNDAGMDGDAVAGDGIYSATLPGRSTNAIEFVLLARDGAGATSRFPELVQDNAPDRECVVQFGDPTPTNLFGTYHLWLSQTNVNRWKSLPAMSNEEIDGTLVYNNRVIYNMGGRYSGGPWHQNYDSPAGTHACHYVWTMPKDDLLLGASAFNQIHWPGNDIQNDTITIKYDDSTLQREQAAYMFLRGLGVPWSYRRFVAVYVNGVRRGNLMEDVFRPTAGTVEDEYFAGDTGVQLYKVQRWYEGSTTSLISECYLRQYTTTDGAFKTARYRPIWGLKNTPGSWSDFTNLYALITAANAYNQSNYVNILETVADMENWMRMSAANHAVGNWDCFGSTSGQNMDAWVSAQHRWTLFTIDLSICLDNRLSGVNLFSMSDPVWQRILATPKFRRMYCRALNELVNGVMRSDVINPVLDAKYYAFLAAGLEVSSPSSTKSWIANQRNRIIAQLAAVNATTFTLGGNTFVASSNSVTLSGTAPVEVVSIGINGANYTPLWTSVSNWSLAVPAASGTNTWTVEARDRYANRVCGTFAVSVENESVPESPAGNIVFNEIMFHPPIPDAEYIELFNRSTNTTFDLSGWIVNGLGYTFPSGSLLPPRNYLLLAKSRTVFAAGYGGLIPVFDEFSGSLQTDGETLSLIQPGTNSDTVVDRVRYEPGAPWPADPARVPGVSLQLVDSAQDHRRVANWSSSLGTKNTPGAANSVADTLPEFPPLWLNEVQAENVSGPTDNFGEHDPWMELYNAGTNSISLSGFHLGTNYANATNWAFPADASLAPGQFLVVWLDGQPAQSTGSVPHASFRLEAAGGKLALARLVNGAPQILDYLNYPALPANYSYGDFPDGQPFYRQTMFYTTPAAGNNALAAPITVSINEWMAENTGWLLDPATGKYDDWFELFNPSGTPADLTGYYLTDNLSNRFLFRIPAGYIVPPNGFLLVWADNQPSANGPHSPNPHVSFKLDKSEEAIGLFAPDGTAIDAVVFGAQTSNISEGRYPDGGALRLFMLAPSPNAANILRPASNVPTVTALSLQADRTFNLTFQTSPGHTYRVEYKNNLDDPAWLPLGDFQFATASEQTINDAPGDSQRFYRVQLLQR